MNNYYEESLNKAVNYIKDNLDGKIRLADIAESAGISIYHFSRIFRNYTGNSIYEAVIRFRVERAAEILSTNSSVTISEIANSAGFSSLAEFRKAFKQRYSVSPSVWRNTNREEESCTLIIPEKHTEEMIEPVSTSIKKLKGFSIAYIKHAEAYAGDTALFIYLYNKLTSWAASMDLLGPERQNIVVYHDPVNITKDPKTKISLGLSVPEDTAVNSEIGKMKLRGGEYLISRFCLKDDEYAKAWKHVDRNVLPELKLLPADGFCFELYPNDVKSIDKYKNIVDICMPVQRQ